MFSRTLRLALCLVFALIEPSCALSHPSNSAPLVVLPYGTFQGKISANLTQFLGIPFAQPPVGKLRFAKPLPPLPKSGIQLATDFGATCPQQAMDSLPLPVFTPFNYSSISEDCLFINVVRPATTKASDKLPVLLWIYGGGFEIGGSSDAPLVELVNRSIVINQPIIVVAANYRLNALGFLGGREVLKAGLANIGLYDQIFAMEWVQKYISAFGGDPKKVVIGGPSAGAVSTANHLLSNGSKKPTLYRGAFMESGSITPTGHVTGSQGAFDLIVSQTGCSSASDKIACLRRVPLDNFMAAVNHTTNTFSYSNVNNTWRPRYDGVLIKENQMVLAAKGEIAPVPLLAGTNDDEGTLFALTSMNVTTDAQVAQYISTFYIPNANTTSMQSILSAYPQDPSQGSPWGTGTASAFTPEYKRVAAFIGDIIFQGPRRFMLEQASKKAPVWGSLSLHGKTTSPLGASHCADGPEWFGKLSNTGYIGVDAFIRFVNTLNPNLRSDGIPIPPALFWPPYTTSGSNARSILTFLDNSTLPTELRTDDYRAGSISLLNELILKLEK